MHPKQISQQLQVSMMLSAMLDVQTTDSMQELWPRGNAAAAECNAWLLSSLEPRETSEVGGVHGLTERRSL